MSAIERNRTSGNKDILKRSNYSVDFSKVGGLSHHIAVLKEIIIFPLIYTDLYLHFNIKVPRGVLFYGPPGTGKTFVAGALTAELNKLGIGKVTFFHRKGADILDKWVGESERKLRELFDKAARSRPSVIFFDELDGLAPKRSSKHDQIHCSVVTTLLALMDGLDRMPGVIVIGATNRIDAVDPALRRSGRFDKELYFPLPSTQGRKEILQVHMQTWKHQPTEEILTKLAEITMGFSGSDIQALCTESVLCCLKRLYPKVQNPSEIRKVKLDMEEFKVEECDFINASLNVVPAAQKMDNKMRKLSPFIQPLLQRQLDNILRHLQVMWPHFLQPFNKFLVGQERYAGRLLLVGSNLQGLNNHLLPAILHALEHLPAHVLDAQSVFNNKNIKDARQNLPAILVLPRIDSWWDLIESSLQIEMTSVIDEFHAGLPLLLIASCSQELPAMLEEYFYNNSSIVIHIDDPTIQEREVFLAPLFFGENCNSLYQVLKLRNISQCVKNIKQEFNESGENISDESKTRGGRSKRKRKKNASTVQLRENTRKSVENNHSVHGMSSMKRIKLDQKCDTDSKTCRNIAITRDNNVSHSTKDIQELLSRNESDSSGTRKKHVTTMLTDILSSSSIISAFDKSAVTLNENVKKEVFLDNSLYNTCEHFLHAAYPYEDYSDGDKVVIFNLWKKAAHVTSKDFSVGHLELFYDTISACINIHKDNFDDLIKHMDKLLDNFEKPGT